MEEKSLSISLSYSIIKYQLDYYSWRHKTLLLVVSMMNFLEKGVVLDTCSACSVAKDLMGERTLSPQTADLLKLCQRAFKANEPTWGPSARHEHWGCSRNVDMCHRKNKQSCVGDPLLPKCVLQSATANSLLRLFRYSVKMITFLGMIWMLINLPWFLSKVYSIVKVRYL